MFAELNDNYSRDLEVIELSFRITNRRITKKLHGCTVGERLSCRLRLLGRLEANFKNFAKWLIGTWEHLFEPKKFFSKYTCSTTQVNRPTTRVDDFATTVTSIGFFQMCSKFLIDTSGGLFRSKKVLPNYSHPTIRFSVYK